MPRIWIESLRGSPLATMTVAVRVTNRVRCGGGGDVCVRREHRGWQQTRNFILLWQNFTYQGTSLLNHFETELKLSQNRKTSDYGHPGKTAASKCRSYSFARNRYITPNLTAFVKIKTRSNWSINECADRLLQHPLQAAMSGRAEERRSPGICGIAAIMVARWESQGGRTADADPKAHAANSVMRQHIEPGQDVKMFSYRSR